MRGCTRTGHPCAGTGLAPVHSCAGTADRVGRKVYVGGRFVYAGAVEATGIAVAPIPPHRLCDWPARERHDSQVWNMATKDHRATGDADDGEGDHWEASPPRRGYGPRGLSVRGCFFLFCAASSGRRCDAGGDAVDRLLQAMGSANSSGLGGLTDADIGEANALVQPHRAGTRYR